MKQNFSSPQGADFVLNFTVKDSTGSARDIEGWSFFMTLKTDKNLPDTDPSVLKITPIIVDHTAGTVVATIPAGTSIDLEGTYYYDVKAKDDNDVILYLVNGVITFSSIVSQRVI